jgi:hypothetical protein
MEISDKHVEWAVINRLKAMLDAPPQTEFNVTQSFAMFTTIVLWTKQRAWASGKNSNRLETFGPTDHAAHDVRERLRRVSIFDEPWSLSKSRPQPKRGKQTPVELVDNRVNSDFEGANAEQFFEWLRNALAHGDGRTITPLYTVSQGINNASLAGFKIADRQADRRTLSLYHSDMRRIGSILAAAFCKSLSGDDKYFEKEAGTATITEAA